MKIAFILSMGLTVLANLAYHTGQKGIPRDASPLLSLAVSYAIALSITLVAWVIWPLTRGQAPSTAWSSAEWARLNASSVIVGVAAFGLELGFLWAYRVGWPVGVAALCSNALVTVALIPIGILCFHEGLTPRRAIGAFLAISGLWALSGI